MCLTGILSMGISFTFFRCELEYKVGFLCDSRHIPILQEEVQEGQEI